MGYGYTCDRCEDFKPDKEPFAMGQFNESEFLGHPIGDKLTDREYDIAETITLCPPCTFALLVGDYEADG